MPILDDLISNIPLSHPVVQTALAQTIAGIMNKHTTHVGTDRLSNIEKMLDEMPTKISQVNQTYLPTTKSKVNLTDNEKVGIKQLQDATTKISSWLNEGRRMAGDSKLGINNTDTQERMSDVETKIAYLERYMLKPGMDKDLQIIRKFSQPIREIRQLVYNNPSMDSLVKASALADELSKNMSMAARISGSSSVQLDNHNEHNRTYNPGETIEAGCLPCGRAHLGTVGEVLEVLADKAKTTGTIDDSLVNTAREELSALFQYDWTTERIAASPQDQQDALNKYIPVIKGLEAQMNIAVDNGDYKALKNVSNQWKKMRSEFRNETKDM